LQISGIAVPTPVVITAAFSPINIVATHTHTSRLTRARASKKIKRKKKYKTLFLLFVLYDTNKKKLKAGAP
jgi:hypothetical protein